MSARAEALALYRQLLRSARRWPGPPEEKAYIKQEAQELFRANRSLTEPAQIEAKLKEGRDRHDVAWHYLIPYPRRHHQRPFKYIEPPVANFSYRPRPSTPPKTDDSGA